MISQQYGQLRFFEEGSYGRYAVDKSARSQSMREGRQRGDWNWNPYCDRPRKGAQRAF